MACTAPLRGKDFVQEMMQLMMTKKMQNLEKKGLKRRAEAAVEASNPGLLENAHSGYALPEPHHKSSYGRVPRAQSLHPICTDTEQRPLEIANGGLSA